MLPDVYDAANLQKSRSQDLSSALIRGGSMQLQQPEKPPAVVLAGERGTSLPSVDLSFHPYIRKPQKSEEAYSENLRDRVAQSRTLDSDLKADCLERLVGVAQRAPRVRRPSWSQQAAEEEVPETDEEAIDITKEDLMKDDVSSPGPAETNEHEVPSPKSFGSRPSAMEAELREVLTPTPELLERAARSQAATNVVHTERQSLGNLLAANQHLAAMAGLSSWGQCTWRPAAPGDDAGESGQQGLPARHSRRRRDSLNCATQAQDLYGWSDAASPHWRFRSSSPRYGGKAPGQSTKATRRSEVKSPKTQASTFGESSGEALPISFESVEETRQAVVMAKNLVASGPEALPRGVTSVLRHALRLVVQSA